jgi:sortase (surface protein transpeptidase)
MSVSIPALGVVDEVVPVGLNPDLTMQIPPVTAVGWYDLGPIPGQRGPSVLAGHVNYNGAQGAFARIGELKPGDAVLVTATNGAQVKFVIYDVIRYPKAAPNLQAAFGDTTVPELHLITCSGAVREHEYADNTVARARLAGA